MERVIKYQNHIYVGLGLFGLSMLRYWCNGPKTHLSRKMYSKVIIVTGSSDGIGKETALQLLRDGAIVIFACRDEAKTMKIINEISNKEEQSRAKFIKLDLSDFLSVVSFLKTFNSQYERLDILINNAAINLANYSLTKDLVETTLQVNVISPILLTQSLLKILHKSNGNVINVTGSIYQTWKKNADYYSKIKGSEYDFEKTSYGSISQYSYSKLGNIYFSSHLADYIKINNLNITTSSIHPGVIKTELTRDLKGFFWGLFRIITAPLSWIFYKNLKMGTQTTLHLCYLDKSDYISGGYYKDCGIAPLNKLAENKENRTAFMNLIKEVINFRSQEIKFELNI